MDIFDLFGINQVLEIFKNKKNSKLKEEKKEEKYIPMSITPKKFSYRPKNLVEYIGQENAKKLVELNIKKIKIIKPIHFCISGTKGAGKSTLAHIISNELEAKITWHIGGAFTKEALIKFLVKNQDDQNNLHILFIDEGHNLAKELAEYLYPILEDFILPEGKNLKLKSFIFITATTERNELIKKFAPLVDRCGADIILEQYNAEDIKAILKQYNDKIYQKNISEEIYDILSFNVRYTPRIALNFFDDFIVCKDIEYVLKSHRVIKNGLTTTDILILSHLAEIKKPVGIEALATIAGVSREDFQYCIEPYILFNSYLTRTARGRLITLKGEQLLKEVNIEKRNL